MRRSAGRDQVPLSDLSGHLPLCCICNSTMRRAQWRGPGRVTIEPRSVDAKPRGHDDFFARVCPPPVANLRTGAADDPRRAACDDHDWRCGLPWAATDGPSRQPIRVPLAAGGRAITAASAQLIARPVISQTAVMIPAPHGKFAPIGDGADRTTRGVWPTRSRGVPRRR